MQNLESQSQRQRPTSFLRFLAFGTILLVLAGCASQSPPPEKSQALSSLAAHREQQAFASPQAAVDALVTASREDNKTELLRILGPNAEKLISSGDKVADEDGRQKFFTAYDAAHELEKEGDAKAVLVVGPEEWPMPIPLVLTNGGWQFDTAQGAEEILNRRIGRNELNVVEVCRAYVEAQEEFAAQAPDGKNYAQRFQSHDGKHDGLYWPAVDGEPESPFGALIANATAEGYGAKTLSRQSPYHGYYFQILKRQGPNASGSTKDYVENGRMTRGFALVAFPARYGDSGIMTFIVNRSGIVYEKNLGPDTAKRARAITQFDPDSSWNVVR